MAVRLTRAACGLPVGSVLAVIAVCLTTGSSGQGPTANHGDSAGQCDADATSGSEPTIDPLSVNASCYVCHMMFVREEISHVRLITQKLNKLP